MLKTARGVAIHADPLHHGDGTGIRRNGDGNDLAELSFLETIVEKRPRSLRHVALSPVSGSQAPTDLDRAVGQVRFEIRACKSTKTNRCIILPEGEREETEAGFVNISVVAIEERIGIRAVAAEGENSTTFGSLLISAKRSRSASSQARSLSRSVSWMITPRSPSSGNPEGRAGR